MNANLLERIDRNERGGSLSQLPVGEELAAVQFKPLLHQVVGNTWQGATDDQTIVDPYERLVLAILCVEVGRTAVSQVHEDHDPVELAEAGHVVDGIGVL
jgi:hypothetical protein